MSELNKSVYNAQILANNTAWLNVNSEFIILNGIHKLSNYNLCIEISYGIVGDTSHINRLEKEFGKWPIINYFLSFRNKHDVYADVRPIFIYSPFCLSYCSEIRFGLNLQTTGYFLFSDRPYHSVKIVFFSNKKNFFDPWTHYRLLYKFRRLKI